MSFFDIFILRFNFQHLNRQLRKRSQGIVYKAKDISPLSLVCKHRTTLETTNILNIVSFISSY